MAQAIAAAVGGMPSVIVQDELSHERIIFGYFRHHYYYTLFSSIHYYS